MRAFIVLCLVAAACAESGYNYGAGIGSSPAGVVAGPSFGGIGGGAGSSFGGIGGGAGSSFGGVGGGAGPSFGGIGGGVGPQHDGGNFGSGSHDAPAFAPQGGELEKEFYTFTANDDDFIEPAASNQYANGGKQGLRVIFIKGPENNGLENAALGLARQAAEQKTAIYVLNKQVDLSDLANKLDQANHDVNHKPEVHFVKYRTPEDAANAQRAIQSQYDQLGGRSQNFNGGVAPVLNFASPAAAGHRGSQGSFGAGSAPSSGYLAPSAGGNVSPNYLPASIFRRFRH